MDILTTTEFAFAECIVTASIDNNLDVNIYNGFDDEYKLAPACVIYAEDGTEDFVNSGIYHVKTSIIVKENGADTSNTSSLANTIFENVLNGNVTKDKLNEYPGYYVFGFNIESVNKSIQDESVFVKTLNLDVICSLR